MLITSLFHCPWEVRGGGGAVSSDFKWWGWFIMNGGKNKNPKTFLGLIQPPMPHFCCTSLGCTLWLRYVGTTMNLQIVWIPKKSLLKSSCTPKKYLPNYFPNQKKSRNRKFQPPKNPFCHCHFKSGVSLLGHCWTAKITM